MLSITIQNQNNTLYPYLFDSFSNNTIYLSKLPISSEKFYFTVRITKEDETKTIWFYKQRKSEPVKCAAT